MTDLPSHYADLLKEHMDKATDVDITTNEGITAMKNLALFSNLQIKQPEPPPTPPVPQTKREKVLARAARILDNETTRTLIKAGGAFAGVGLVTWTTIRRDHVMERQALAQANQRPI